MAAATTFRSNAESGPNLGWAKDGRQPSIAIIGAGMSGIASVMGIQFRADGKLIDTAKRTNKLTDINANQSMSRFAMPFDDFVTIATASDVRMRVDSIDNYVVSTFGKSNDGAVVNTKFSPFLAKIQELRASPSG